MHILLLHLNHVYYIWLTLAVLQYTNVHICTYLHILHMCPIDYEILILHSRIIFFCKFSIFLCLHTYVRRFVSITFCLFSVDLHNIISNYLSSLVSGWYLAQGLCVVLLTSTRLKLFNQCTVQSPLINNNCDDIRMHVCASNIKYPM